MEERRMIRLPEEGYVYLLETQMGVEELLNEVWQDQDTVFKEITVRTSKDIAEYIDKDVRGLSPSSSLRTIDRWARYVEYHYYNGVKLLIDILPDS